MNSEDFKILLGSYGADLMRWPKELHEKAAPLFLKHSEWVEEAEAMDALLDRSHVDSANQELLDRITSAAWLHDNDNILPKVLKPLWARSGVAAALAAIGFWCGSVSLPHEAAYAAKEPTAKPMLIGPTRMSEVML
jgi:hypothetical protein